jgi:hypothetical protein
MEMAVRAHFWHNEDTMLTKKFAPSIKDQLQYIVSVKVHMETYQTRLIDRAWLDSTD